MRAVVVFNALSIACFREKCRRFSRPKAPHNKERGSVFDPIKVGRTLAAVVMLAPVGLGGALAADDKPGRFTMMPTDGGALKLDTATGAVSLCTRASGDWACVPTQDGEQALRQQIEGLKAENDVLKDQLVKMEELAGIGDPRKTEGPLGGPRPGGGSDSKMGLPTEKEVDQAFDYFESMVKKLRERFNKLEGPSKHGTPL